MRVKMSLEDVLHKKAKAGVVTADASLLMREAVQLMATHNIGALVVTDNGAPVGIVTERDVLRNVARTGASFLETPVSDCMTCDIMVGTYDIDVEAAKAVMTERRFRHMPIMHDGKLVGIVSIGDIVHSQLTTAQAETLYLRDYIRGRYS